jgi:starch synthase (maltosyl-transferring)
MILYNLFPLLAGPFNRWEPHLKRAAEMGFDWVFVNPVQRLGASGSLYSIADYFSFNPVFLDPATAASPEEQFRRVIEQARGAGLKMMTDLVINHCAFDSPLTREHPEWFVREPNGRIANASCQQEQKKIVWKDLAQFDYQHSRDPEGLYRHCLKVVEHLLGQGFEGFRCDAAYQVPRRFWHRLIHEVRAHHPHALFVAETLGCNAEQVKETARAGFDYVFNSSKYWNFQDWWLIAQYNLVRETTRSISFPESHDTRRLAEEFNGGVDAMKQHYLFSALFSSGVMIPIGFEFGFRKQLHVVRTTPDDWENPSMDLRPFITKVNAIKKAYHVFHEESLTNLLQCNNPNVLLMWKAASKHTDEALLILNKDSWHHQEFYTDTFHHYIESGGPLRDISPEYPLDYIHQPFHYALRPGQGIILIGSRA